MRSGTAAQRDFGRRRIGRFLEDRPGVVFDLKIMDHDRAMVALATYDVDLALVFRPAAWPSVRVIAAIPQRLVAIMRANHPLTEYKALRLSDCAAFPAALPDRSLSGRQLLDGVAARKDFQFLTAAESSSFEMLRGLALRCNMITFQIEIGAPASDLSPGLVSRAIDDRDVPRADLVLCQLRGRALSAAAARFAELLRRPYGKPHPAKIAAELSTIWSLK